MTWKIDVGINIAHLQFFPVLFDLADDNLWWHHLNPWSTCSLLAWQPRYIMAQLLAMKLSINQKKKKKKNQLSFISNPSPNKCCSSGAGAAHLLPHLLHRSPWCFLPCPSPWKFPCIWLFCMPVSGNTTNDGGCENDFSPAQAGCLLFRSGTPAGCSWQEKVLSVGWNR